MRAAHPLVAALLAMALLSGMDALIKAATAALGTWQIVALRYAFGLAAALPFAWAHLRRRVPRASWAPNLARGLLVVATAAQFFFALGRLPLIEAATLAFTAPLWVVVLGRLVLGEAFTLRALAAVALGFAGVLIVGAATPATAGARDALGTATALGAAVTYALAMVLVRRRSAHDPVPVMVLIQSVGALVVAAPLAAASWRPMEPALWSVFAVIGLLGTLGHLLLSSALARARAADLAPAEYTTLLWAFAFGAAFFGERPGLGHALGAGLIALGCLVASRAEPERATARGAVVDGPTAGKRPAAERPGG